MRGDKEVPVTMSSARLQVSSHHKKRLIIALKYEGENEYRYIVASNLSWRTIDVVQAYTLRWLVEIFHSQYPHIPNYNLIHQHFVCDAKFSTSFQFIY
ncbi:MAG: hypothetical protein V1872_05495 [bacterium]